MYVLAVVDPGIMVVDNSSDAGGCHKLRGTERQMCGLQGGHDGHIFNSNLTFFVTVVDTTA